MADISTCDRCGGGVPAGATTCPNCGAPVAGGESGGAWQSPGSFVASDPLAGSSSSYSQPEPARPAWSAPQPAPAPVPAPPAYSPPPPAYMPPAPEIFPGGLQDKKRSPWLWAAGCCVGVLFLLCCVGVVAVALALAPAGL